MNRKNKIWISIITLVFLVLAFLSVPNIFYKNNGESKSVGTPGNGYIDNPYQLKYFTRNSQYFSVVSYYILDNAFVHSSLVPTLAETYKECEKTCPGIKFRIMECSGREGGKRLIHRTHRNGLSIDFMVPKMKHGAQTKFFDQIGLWHYLLNFDAAGRLTLYKKVSIDFNTLGKHIIALDNAARRNGLRITKVIFKLELKDDLFNTEAGREIKRRGIYFARNLPDVVNKLHDDHYHIDFELVND